MRRKFLFALLLILAALVQASIIYANAEQETSNSTVDGNGGGGGGIDNNDGEVLTYENLLAEINALKKLIPDFYETYCTLETANNLTQALTNLNSTLTSYGSENLTAEQLAALNNYKNTLKTCIDNLIFNYDSVIPRFFISTRNKDTREHYYNTLTKPIGKVPAQITLVDAGGEVIVKDLDYDNATIKVRGNSTASGAKKPYNIKFSKKQNLFTFGKSKKWVLLADYYDPTLMRNKIALDLGKKLGLNATPDNKRVEVYVDGEYRGVYLLTEKIEADKNRVNIETESGDFLVEMDTYVEQENIYFTTSVLGQHFRLHEPEEAGEAERIKLKVEQLEEILKSGDWEQVQEIIDVNSFVAYYILNEFMKTGDFVWKSVYFYYKDGKFYGGPCWDFDYSSGHAASASLASPEGLYASIAHYYKYLMKIPEFQKAVFEKIREIFTSEPIIFEEIYKENGLIDSEVSSYADAITRNNKIWDVRYAYAAFLRSPEPTYEGNINYLKSWLKARHEWLANYFLNRIYKDPQDGNYYYYKNGEKTQAGIIELDNNYYYAGEGGKISTGEFELDGNLYKADETGKFLAQDLSVELFSDNNNLMLDEGKAGLIKFNLNVAANYGGTLIKNLTSGYAVVYTLENAPENILINNNGLLSVNNQAQAGEYEVKVTASVTLDGVTQSESINFKIIINKVQEPAPAPAASEPEPVQIITPEPMLIQEIAKYNPASWGDETAQQVALIEAALDLEQAATQGMNAQVSETNIEAVKNSGLVMGLQEVIAFGSNAQPDTKLDSIASAIAQTLAANAAIFTGSQSAENLLKVETTFGDLRAFLFEAQNNINDGSQLAASAAPFKAAQAGVYFIKLDLGDTSGLIGKRLNYFATPFSSNNSQAQAKALKFNLASANNNLNQGKLLDADGNEIIEYQGGDINAVIYIESAGEAYGQFITAQEITEQEADNAQEANVSNEDNNDNYNYTEDVDTSPYSHSGCNALSFNGLPLLLIITLALFKRKKL